MESNTSIPSNIKFVLFLGSNLSNLNNKLLKDFRNLKADENDKLQIKILEKQNFEELKLEQLCLSFADKPAYLLVFETFIEYVSEIVFHYCDKIFYISNKEENYFRDAILNQVNKEKYSSQWQKYVESTKTLLDKVKQLGICDKLFIFDSDSQDAHSNVFNHYTMNEELDQSYFLSIEEVLKNINVRIPNRPIKEVKESYYKFKYKINHNFDKKSSRWIQLLNDKNESLKYLAIDDIIEEFDKTMSHEEMASIMRAFTIKKISNFSHSTSVYLIHTLIEILDNIDTFCSKRITKLLHIFDVIEKVSKHFIHGLYILNDEKYIALLHKMLENKIRLIRIKATSMMEKIIFRDHKRYGTKFIEYDKRNNKSTVCLLFKVIMVECENLFSMIENSMNLTGITHIYENFQIQSLKYLMLGSIDNTSQLELKDINELIKFTGKVALIDEEKIFEINNNDVNQLYKFLIRKVCDLFSVLTMSLKYGPTTLWQQINTKEIMFHLVSLMSKSIKNSILIENQLKKIAELYLNLISFNEFNKYNLDDNIDFRSTDNDEKFYENSSMAIESIDSLNLEMNKNIDSKIQDYLNDQRMKAELEEKYEELKYEKECLKKKYDESNNKINLLEDELDRKKLEIKTLLKELENLRSKNEKLNHNFNSNEASIERLNQRINHSPNNNSNIDENDYDSLKEMIIENKDQAKELIEKIGNNWKKIVGLKGFIRGSIKNLGTKLYTESIHFLYEIIQNVEDSDFSIENPTLKIILDKDYILFCSNEDGFKVKDILSICSLSESNKEKGKSFGHKGLGFKSIFACTTKPMILSNYFQFYFDTTSTKDEIAQLIPIYLDDNLIPNILSQLRSQNSNFNTFLFVPLKSEFTYSENKMKFYQSFTKAINDNLHHTLLFTNKLSKIIFVNQIINKTIEMYRNVSQSISQNLEIELNEIQLMKENERQNYRVYTESVLIPSDMANEEEMKERCIKLTVAFQTELSKRQSFYVFCGLPIRNIDFPFLLNTYWSLNTSREDITDCSYNSFLRDKMTELCSYALINDSVLNSSIQFYLPELNKTNNWWNIFVDKIKDNIKPSLNSAIGLSKTTLKRVYNSELDQLIDENILKLVNIEIIKELNLNKNFLQYYEIKTLSFEDILWCLHNETIEKFKELNEWIENRSNKWWKIFFYELLKSNIELNRSKYKIFLQRDNVNEVSKRIISLDDKVNYYLSNQSNIKMWMDAYKILEFRSEYEEKYLKEKMHIQVLSNVDIINIILRNHKKNGKNINKNYVIHDIKFIKDNYSEQFNNNNFNCLMVPTIKNGLQPLKFTYVSSIFGYDLSKLPTYKTHQLNMIDIKLLADITSSPLLEWELFFLKINVKVPYIDINDMMNNLSSYPLLKEFDSYSKEDIRLSLELFNNLKAFNCNFIQYLPIKCLTNNGENVITSINKVCSAYSQKEFNNILPCVNVPDDGLELAERFGVSVKINFDSCISVLLSLVSNSIKNSEVYIEWFLKLQLFIKEDHQNVSMIKIMCLETCSDNAKEFYALSDVYICQDNSIYYLINLVCNYLGKTLIAPNKNREFKSIETILLNLGAKIEPNLDDLIQTIIKMSKDEDLFINKNQISILTTEGYENFKLIYLYLEKYFRNLVKFEKKVGENDWKIRLEIEKIVQQNEIFEEYSDNLDKIFYITFDRHLIPINDLRLRKSLCCFSSEAINILNLEHPNDFYIFNPQIGLECPFIVSLLGCIYFEIKSIMKLSHWNNNMENTNQIINSIFRELVNKNDVEVFNAKYVALSIYYSLELDEITIEKIDENDKKVKSQIFWNKLPYTIINKKWIICSGISYSIYLQALGQLLKELKPELNQNDINKIIDDNSERIFLASENKHEIRDAVFASSEADFFKMSDVIFPNKQICDDLSEIYFNGISINDQTKMLKKKINFIKSDYRATYDLFEMRLKELNITNLSDINSFQSEQSPLRKAPVSIVNSELQKSIGFRAECFFCIFLKSLYRDSFNEYEQWVSSAKLKIFENCSEPNDSAGYDFEVNDEINFFTDDKFNKNTKKCFFEVKGCAGPWDGTFHLSKNEYEKNKNTLKDTQSYVIAIVHNVNDDRHINIAKIINWSDNPNIFNEPEPDSYKITLNNSSKLNEENSNNSNRNENKQQIWRPSGNSFNYNNRSINSRSTITNELKIETNYSYQNTRNNSSSLNRVNNLNRTESNQETWRNISNGNYLTHENSNNNLRSTILSEHNTAHDDSKKKVQMSKNKEEYHKK